MVADGLSQLLDGEKLLTTQTPTGCLGRGRGVGRDGAASEFTSYRDCDARRPTASDLADLADLELATPAVGSAEDGEHARMMADNFAAGERDRAVG